LRYCKTDTPIPLPVLDSRDAYLSYAKADSVLFVCMDHPNDSNDATNSM
jgi:hypothetical protein